MTSFFFILVCFIKNCLILHSYVWYFTTTQVDIRTNRKESNLSSYSSILKNILSAYGICFTKKPERMTLPLGRVIEGILKFCVYFVKCCHTFKNLQNFGESSYINENYGWLYLNVIFCNNQDEIKWWSLGGNKSNLEILTWAKVEWWTVCFLRVISFHRWWRLTSEYSSYWN